MKTKQTYLKNALLIGAAITAGATQMQAGETSFPVQQEEKTINFKTASVDKYGVADLGITFEELPDNFLLSGDGGCGNAVCGNTCNAACC
jgi:hypothetical protein